MLQAGQLFAGRYRVERFLAQGGMGVIYEAEHLATEERVALKVLWPQVLRSASAVEKFQLEARIAARIGSEHIVRILDAGYDGALAMPYLAMELLRGQTLQAVVNRHGPLARAEALLALRHVAKALDKAHTSVDREGRPAPIVHRDLKPDNLFVALRDEGEAVVKVLDFGIAKVLNQSQALSQEVRGTPRFMAYEQFTTGPVTPRLDVWALGLIVFYLLTGHNYWRAVGAGNENGLAPLLSEVLLTPLEPPSERAKALGVGARWPAAFDAWFFRCVNRDLDARFASAGEAARAFAEVLGGGVEPPAAELAAARTTLAAKGAPGPEPPPVAPAPGAPNATPLVGATYPLMGAPPPPGPVDVIVAPSWPLPTLGEPSEPALTPAGAATTGSVASSLPFKPARPSLLPGRRTTVGSSLLGVGALLGVVLGGRALLTREPLRPDVAPAPSVARPEAPVLPAATSEARPVVIAPISAGGGGEAPAHSVFARAEPPPTPSAAAKPAEAEGARARPGGRPKDGAREPKRPPPPKPVATQQYYDDR